LDFTINEYGDNQIHGFIRFLDPNNYNFGKDTKIISLARFIEELWMILWYGGHLGRHLEFHPFCQIVHPSFFTYLGVYYQDQE